MNGSLRASFTFIQVLVSIVNRHHLIHNIHHCSLRTQTYFRLSLEPVTAGNTSAFAGYHHWGIAKSLESCRHIIHCALPFPCCPFGIVGKRRYLIEFYESVKCEKILWLFFANTTEHVVRCQHQTRSKVWIRKCIVILQL